MAEEYIDKYKKLLANPKVQAMLRTIRYAEGTSDENGYGTRVGGEKFSDFSKKPRKKVYIKSIGDYSSAEGAYQFLDKTWDGVSKKLGLKDFSPQSQDIAAVELIIQRGAMEDVLSGSFKKAINKLSPEWASLPKDGGGSTYKNQRAKSMNSLSNVFYNGKNSTKPISNVSGNSTGVLADYGEEINNAEPITNVIRDFDIPNINGNFTGVSDVYKEEEKKEEVKKETESDKALAALQEKSFIQEMYGEQQVEEQPQEPQYEEQEQAPITNIMDTFNQVSAFVDNPLTLREGGKVYAQQGREFRKKELLGKEALAQQKDKEELRTTGTIKNPKSQHYKKATPKQAEVRKQTKSDAELDGKLGLERPLIYLANPEKALGDLGVPTMETSELDRQAVMANRFNPNQTREERLRKSIELGLGYVPEATVNTAMAAAFMPEGSGALGLVNETINPFVGMDNGLFKNIKTSIAPELRQGLRTAGISFEPKFNIKDDHFYRSIGIDGADDALSSGNIRSKQVGDYAGKNPYFVEGADFDKLYSTGSGATSNKPEYIFEMPMVDKSGESMTANRVNQSSGYVPYVADKNQIPLSEGSIYKLNSKGEYEVFNTPNLKNKFQSEINWGEWNKEIPDNSQLMKEYNAIEQQAKADGSWMKNSDDSAFQGTPEQFIQQNSENFKKAFTDGFNKTYRGASNNNTFRGSLASSDNPNLGSIFAGNKNSVSHYGSTERFVTPEDIIINQGSPGLMELAYKPSNNKVDFSARMSNWDNINRDILPEPHNKMNPATQVARENPSIVTTDDISRHLQDNNLDYASIKNINDGAFFGEEVIFNHKPDNYLKSLRYNNGMFDMTNPNIYKSVLPLAGASYLATQGQEELPIKQQGGQTRDMYGNPITPTIKNEKIPRSYYAARTETIHLGEDYNKMSPSEQSQALAHENRHDWQYKNDRTNFNITHNSDIAFNERLQKKPVITNTDEVWNKYHNRKSVEIDYDLKNQKQANPEFQFVPNDILYDKIIDDAQYNNPRSMEGEAQYYQATGNRSFQQGGENMFTITGNQPLILPSQGSYPLSYRDRGDRDIDGTLFSASKQVSRVDANGNNLSGMQIRENQKIWNNQKEAYSPQQQDFNTWKNNSENTQKGSFTPQEYYDMAEKLNSRPNVQLEGLETSRANKRGSTKGSCTTGQTMGGDSLKDNRQEGGKIYAQEAGHYKTTTGETVIWGTPEYEKAYNRGEVVTDKGVKSEVTVDGGQIEEIKIQNNYKRNWLEQYRDKILEENKDAGVLGAIVGTPISAVASLPQLFSTKAITGKMQRPSEAVGFDNKQGLFESPASFGKHASNFVLDAVTDPANLIGAGVLTKENALARIAASKESGLLSNAYKLNPMAFKANPEAYYRQAGESAFQDAVVEGKVYTKGQKKVLAENPDLNYDKEYNVSIDADKNGKFNLAKPSPAPFVKKGELFYPIDRKPTGKGYKGTKYADAEYLFEGNLPDEAILPRYQEKYLPSLDNSAGVGVVKPEFNDLSNFNIYKKDWLKGYKQVEVPNQVTSLENTGKQVQKSNNDLLNLFNTSEGKRRLELLGIDNSKLKSPTLAFKSTGSGYFPTDNTLDIDIAEAIQLGINPKSIYEHEVGHWLQKQYGDQSTTQMRQKFYETPIDKEFIASYPENFADDLLAKNPSADFGKVSKETSAAYMLNNGEEGLPFLREMRQNMLNKNYIKHPYEDIPEETINKFIKENPDDRVSSFTQPNSKQSKTIHRLFKNLPAVLPIAGVATIASQNQEVKQQGGTKSIINNRPYGEGMINNWYNSLEFDETEQKNIQKDFNFLNDWYKNRKFVLDEKGRKVAIKPTNISEYPDVVRKNDLGYGVKAQYFSSDDVLDKNTIALTNEFRETPGVFGHELNHKYQDSMTDKQSFDNIFYPISSSDSEHNKYESMNNSEESYQHNPKEIHSRLMQFRQQNNLKPQIFLKIEDIKKLKGKETHQLDMFDDKELMDMLNRSVNNYKDDKQKQIAKQGGIVKDNRGQWKNPGEITEINSPNITMKGVNYDVLGVSKETGEKILMKPEQDYFFKNTKNVIEYPQITEDEKAFLKAVQQHKNKK